MFSLQGPCHHIKKHCTAAKIVILNLYAQGKHEFRIERTHLQN